ncbi:MAG: hypothetical protein H0W04_00750 [Chthoniobacterales bacterium]|nr:hypothetical protein [Chthoniobacterales bacterium]
MNIAPRLLTLLSLFSLPAIMPAQQSSPGERPDISDKALITEASPAAKRRTEPKGNKPVKQYTIEQFMKTTRVGGSAFSADEQSILSTATRAEFSMSIARQSEAAKRSS